MLATQRIQREKKTILKRIVLLRKMPKKRSSLMQKKIAKDTEIMARIPQKKFPTSC